MMIKTERWDDDDCSEEQQQFSPNSNTARTGQQKGAVVMLLNEGERKDEADGDGDLEEEREMVRIGMTDREGRDGEGFSLMLGIS